MTKEEAIKEAYGEYWFEVRMFVNENGWFDKNSLYNNQFTFKYSDFDAQMIHKQDFCIPKSLQGIENNNGWIKIVDGKELPCESINCFIDLGDDDIRNGSYFKPINDSTGTFFDNNGDPFLMDEVEAFYPIEKPKQRIY